ncbi:19460_t:CDS:2 [Funneliformis geosporum]|uniref:15751_t:CDS:1 n=1 Tax=Funneliformis geosporum TaxID=1117311 RepID=A0A9W4WY93_9GLOM|nr:15751_t:CDS:2 [Funneliformis geosporum]CAI2188237.1 19460_t:CDS:2 [Funneliformis geosporum]
MRINEIFQSLLLIVVFSCLISHVDATCDPAEGTVNNDGKVTDFHTSRTTSSAGDITFRLIEMPCDTPYLKIHVVPKSEDLTVFDWRTITDADLNRDVVIGTDVLAGTTFRLQTQVQDVNDFTCYEPTFRGQICYP